MKIPSLIVALVAFVALSPPAHLQDPQPADLVLRGAVVHTLNPARPTAEAIAVIDDRIAFVGSSRDVTAWIGDATRVVDFASEGAGMAIYPSFADSHLHLVGHGEALRRVDLVGTTSYDEVIARVVARAETEQPNAWILGRGWDQNDWDDKTFPHHAALSAAVPDNPVILRRIDGHALLANQRALELARADGPLSWEQDGGRIITDENGETGVFIDRAMALVQRVAPATSESMIRASVTAAIEDLHAHGITSIHDAGISTSAVELYADMIRKDAFDLRVHALLSGHDPTLKRALRGDDTPFPTPDYTGHGRLAVRAIKLSIDGALGSRGAALLEDYSDEPGNNGLLLETPEYVEDTARRALRHGFQLCVHAIGDRGNRAVLDAFARAMTDVRLTDRAVPSPRFRIEHAQILHPDDVSRFASLGIIPSMQALHLTSDMPWAATRVGDRVRGAYVWRALLDTGVIIPGGSDAPVEVPSAILGFHAAITRRNAEGEPTGGWSPDQAMTRAEALQHLTLWPAIAAFDEHRLGSLEVGKLADIVVTDGDLMTLEPQWIPRVAVRMTVFDGRVVHEAAGPSLAARRASGDVTAAYEP